MTTTSHPPSRPEMLIITGMSGAGRATAANMLEDLGWFVVENLPPQMLVPLAQLTAKGGAAMPTVAAVVDVRGAEFFADNDLRSALYSTEAAGVNLRILFLDAEDAALVRRFESVRRPHPLQGEGRILDGIKAERRALREVRGMADLTVDTTNLNVHQLSARISELFSTDDQASLRLQVMSFGFKYGMPVDADHVVDVRFLPNPYWVPELKGHNGTETVVQEFVFNQPGAEEFLTSYRTALEPVLDGYVRENRPYATVAVGCTGGKHRSVAMTVALGKLLHRPDVQIRVTHRDLGRE